MALESFAHICHVSLWVICLVALRFSAVHPLAVRQRSSFDGITTHLRTAPRICSVPCAPAAGWSSWGKALAWIYHSSLDYLAEEFILAWVLLLGFLFIAQWSKIHLFHWCLGWTLVIFQVFIKIYPIHFKKASILLFLLLFWRWCQAGIFRIFKFPATK